MADYNAKAVKPITLGDPVPAFSLIEPLSGRLVSAGDFGASQALLVAFICNHCPYVIHLRSALVDFAGELQPKGLALVAISANDPTTHPQDGPAMMAREAQRARFTFPYLFDETQQTAASFGAVCTPEFFLFDRARRLVYRGRFDATRPGSKVPPSGDDLRAAVDAVLAGRAVTGEQHAAVGCSIKWRAGHAPAYA